MTQAQEIAMKKEQHNAYQRNYYSNHTATISAQRKEIRVNWSPEQKRIVYLRNLKYEKSGKRQALKRRVKMKKYQIIYADPPWSYNDKLGSKSAKMGGYDKYYKGMSLDSICNLNVKDIADDNCILFLWITMPKIFEAKKVIESWGFVHKTTAFTWVKLNPKAKTVFKGIGRWVQGNAELVLLATKGKPQRITKDVPQIVMECRGKHSVKPLKVAREIIRLMGDIPRIELFARDKTDGWDVWGNEVDSDIDLEAIGG